MPTVSRFLIVQQCAKRVRMMTTWHLITGEYPPQHGGVSDYTRLVAHGLAACGDQVHVWAPECRTELPSPSGVILHRLPGHFSPRALTCLDAALRRQPRPFRLLVQYVPHMYGWKAMNLPFCLWLAQQRQPAPWVMFHEVAFPCSWKQQLVHNVLGAVTHVMAGIVARSAEQVFVSIPGWIQMLRRIAPRQRRITWLPIPSTIATAVPPDSVQRVRADMLQNGRTRVVGHFGTFSSVIHQQLSEIMPQILRHQDRVGMLIGRNSRHFLKQLMQREPSLSGRVFAGEDLSAEDVAAHLAACDVLVQPYPDGASSRRTSLMAGLALGQPIVTTYGRLSEPVWQDDFVGLAQCGDLTTMVNLVEQILADDAQRRRLADRAKAAYQRYFSIERTIQTLRDMSM